jgi:predicted small secreted protein
MRKLLIIALLLGSFSAKAETDKVAHFGVSYALQTGMYGLSKKAFRLKKSDALIFSIFATMLVTTAAEYMPGQKFDKRDILANGLGVGAASATILMFDF